MTKFRTNLQFLIRNQKFNKMKSKLFLILSCFVLTLIAGNKVFAQEQEIDSATYSLRVIVEGINATEGTLVVGVADKQNYDDHNFRACNQKVPITSQTMELNFENLRAGEYAIFVVVKEEKLDSLKADINPMEEQTGFSQNIKRPWKVQIDENGKALLYSPQFKDICFFIPQKRTMRIMLGNPSKSVELIKEKTK